MTQWWKDSTACLSARWILLASVISSQAIVVPVYRLPLSKTEQWNYWCYVSCLFFFFQSRCINIYISQMLIHSFHIISQIHITVTRAQPGSCMKNGKKKNRGLWQDLVWGQHGASLPSDEVLTFHHYWTLQKYSKYFSVGVCMVNIPWHILCGKLHSKLCFLPV